MMTDLLIGGGFEPGQGPSEPIVNPATGEVVRAFPTGERTWGIGLSPDETRLYAASGISGTLTIIDIVGNKVLKKVNLGGRPWGALAARK